MADIELVVKIPEEEYRWIIKSDETVFASIASKECMLHAIKNGTPLSKGHGRLIDADKYMKRLQLEINSEADTIAKYIKEDVPIGTVKDCGRIGRLQGVQWCKNVLELDYYTVEAIHKADYENRLKADMVAMLQDLDLQIDESAAYNLGVAKVQRLIRDKIDKLKENKEVENGCNN